VLYVGRLVVRQYIHQSTVQSSEFTSEFRLQFQTIANMVTVEKITM